jgi:hypothetical protein
MPNNTTVAAACEELERVMFNSSENNLIIFYNLDCAAYYARQEDGSLIPARQLDGHYHIDGELVVAPKEMFTRTLKHCTPLLQLHPNIKKIVISPTPRYWILTCCADVEHVNNFYDADFEATMFEGLDTLQGLHLHQPHQELYSGQSNADLC